MMTAFVIAGGELRLILRSRLALIGMATLLALSMIAALTSWRQMEAAQAARAASQHAADAAFKAQPGRHPHRMVHYGSYAIRPVGPLAAFDPGVDAFTGTVLYLEGHRQNSATFGAARESSGLVRFGQLTPAFVLQTLAPLLLVFLGFAGVAREREGGGLVTLRAHGATAFQIIGGKALALAMVALAAAAPALAGLALAASAAPAEAAIAALIALASLVYLLGWALMVTAVSALARTAQGALIALIALWSVTVILLPRGAAAVAGLVHPLPGRAETELAINADLRRLGDSHNPDDPFFAAFRARLLRQYGVTRVEDLPFNYRGALSAEGERLTAALFARYAARAAAIQRDQLALVDALSWASPAIAVRRLAMLGAATDLRTHLAFLDQAEAHRYRMVQRLNAMHATRVSAADDARRSTDAEAERRSRIAAASWREIPDFTFSPPDPGARRTAMAVPLIRLLGWLGAALLLMMIAARRMEVRA